MGSPSGGVRRCRFGATATLLVLLTGPSGGAVVDPGPTREFRVRISRWPCRLVVKPTLLGVIEAGWARSPTLRAQCEALAAARAVVTLEWGPPPDSQARARAHLDRRDGVVVARIIVPPCPETLELVAHELQHVIELATGLDFEAESTRPGSGVWRAAWGFETQAAIEAGRRVGRELNHPDR